MADFLYLAFCALVTFLLAGAIYYSLKAVWHMCLWVFGLVTVWSIHRDDISEALTLERALKPLGGRDRNGNLISTAPPRLP